MKDTAQLQLATEVLEAWRKTLIHLARLPKGLSPKTHAPHELIAGVLRQEAPEIERLWTIFNQERGSLGRHLLTDKRAVVGYLGGFHLANAARAALALSRADARAGLWAYLAASGGRLVWHDLGCGTGAIAQVAVDQALRAGVSPEAVEVHLSDAVGSLLDAAKVLFRHAGLEAATRTHRLALESLNPERLAPPPGTALVAYSLGYVWNELKNNPTARGRILGLLEARCQRGEAALAVILEPATQESARDAMVLRDQLVSQGYVPLYPCPHAKPCPMLERSRDWCYSEAVWDRPLEMARLDAHLTMDRSRLNTAAHVLASPALAAKLGGAGLPSGVVVGRPARLRGEGFDYLVCGQDGHLSKETPASFDRPQLRGTAMARGEAKAPGAKARAGTAASARPRSPESRASEGPGDRRSRPRGDRDREGKALSKAPESKSGARAPEGRRPGKGAAPGKGLPAGKGPRKPRPPSPGKKTPPSRRGNKGRS